MSVDTLFNMTWDRVMTQIIALLESDAVLLEALGGLNIYSSEASRAVIVPSVVWYLLGDQLDELLNPMQVQFDYFAPSREQAVVIEDRLRSNLHYPVRREIGGIDMATLYEDRFEHDYTTPGQVHVSLRFEFQPVRRIVADES